jgi:hypothetical protein
LQEHYGVQRTATCFASNPGDTFFVIALRGALWSLELVVVRHGNEADVAGGNPLAISSFDEQFWQRLRVAFKY